VTQTRRAEHTRGWARRALWPIIVAVVLVGVLFVGVYPTQTYFRQQEELVDKRDQLDEVETQNAELEEQVDELNDPEALELIARMQYGLVRPGEEVYAVVASERDPVTLPDTWPFTQLQVRLDRQVN
jgi:cell division protein DivIC